MLLSLERQCRRRSGEEMGGGARSREVRMSSRGTSRDAPGHQGDELHVREMPCRCPSGPTKRSNSAFRWPHVLQASGIPLRRLFLFPSGNNFLRVHSTTIFTENGYSSTCSCRRCNTCTTVRSRAIPEPKRPFQRAKPTILTTTFSGAN